MAGHANAATRTTQMSGAHGLVARFDLPRIDKHSFKNRTARLGRAWNSGVATKTSAG
jgi:hypothetical protein